MVYRIWSRVQAASMVPSSPHVAALRVIGNRIRSRRFARGLSLQVAYEIRKTYGVKLDPSYLSRIERGKTEIPLRTLFALADFFKLDPGKLLVPLADSTVSELDFILEDSALVARLARLREMVGADYARERIRGFLEDLLGLLQDLTPGESAGTGTRPRVEAHWVSAAGSDHPAETPEKAP